MSEPPARKPGNHSTRWRTTSRACHSATGLARPTLGGDAAHPVGEGRGDAAVLLRGLGRDQRPIPAGRPGLVEGVVALVDADLHAAGHHPGLGLHRLDDRPDLQPGPPVAEVVQHQRVEADRLGHLVEAEGLDDLLGPPTPGGPSRRSGRSPHRRGARCSGTRRRSACPTSRCPCRSTAVRSTA